MIAPTWADSFVDTIGGGTWATSPANMNEAVNRIATALATLLGTPIP